MLLQDEKGGLSYAKEEGRLPQAIALVNRQLKKHFGEITAGIISKMEDLPLAAL